jgi:hypothetical protein
MKRCAISLAMCFCLLSMTAVAWTNDAQKAVIGTHEIMTVDVPLDITWDKPVFVQGVLRKTGAGKLTLPAEKLYGQGCVEVVDGELAVTATGAGSAPVAEPAILNGAAMWLDANLHLAGADGAAATDRAAMWYDVRETDWATAGGFATNYIYAEGRTNLTATGLLPACGTDGNGRKYVDFGGYASGQYMVWRKPSGDKAWIPIANSFVAYSPNGSHGHYLGVATDYGVDRNKVMYFAVNMGGESNFFFVNQAHAQYRHLRFGHVFCNGIAVDPLATIDKAATQLLETESYPVEGYAEAFFNFRNYQASAGSGSAGDRVGGGRLHEVLIFTNRISEVDRILVEQYLLRKWVNSSGYAIPPKFRVMSGAALTLDGRLETSVQSAGVLRRTGPLASLDAVDAFAGIGGTVVIDTDATVSNRFGAAIAPQAGKAYTVDDWNTVSVSDGTAGTISKTGTGTLALAGLGSAATLAVADGQAAVRAVATNATVELSGNCLADGGFEGIYTGTTYQHYTTGASMGAWTATNYCSGANTRITYKTGWGPQWKNDPQYKLGTPEGSYYLLLKNGGGVKQSVTLPKAGRYEVTLRTYPRSDALIYIGFARLYMDDVLIGTAQSPAQQLDWDYIRFESPWLDAGPHVFRIASETTEDLALAIDDVQVRWLDDTPAVAVLKNGNFEDADWEAGSSALIPSVAVSTAISTTIQTETALPSTFLTGWTADGTVTLLRGQPYFRTSNFAAPLTGTGSICAFLQTGASVRQTVTIPEDGLYVLSAAVANYATNGLGSPTASYDAAYTSGKVQFTLGETNETFSFGDWSLQRHQLSIPVRLAMGETVEVAITAPATTSSGRNNILVDDVRLERVTDNLVANPGFEGGGGAKAPTGWTVVSNPLDKQILYTPQDVKMDYFGDEMVEGMYRARLHAGTHLAQTLTLDPGLYRLSFWEVSRTWRNSKSDPWLVVYGPSPICVTLVRGATTNFCATVTPSSTRKKFMRRECLVKVEEAGEWTLGFEATASTNDDLSSFIDAVCLAPVRDMPDTAVPSAAPDVSLEVAAGASLALDWPGVFTCGRLRCAGTSFVGDISSATAPDSLFGVGRLSIAPKGTVIIFR